MYSFGVLIAEFEFRKKKISIFFLKKVHNGSQSIIFVS